MIVAEQKPFDEILKMLDDFNDIAIAACGTCVTVCMAGGEKEAQNLAYLIKLEREKEGRPVNVKVISLKRQCDLEFIDDAEEDLKKSDVILSLGCGAGVQFIAEKFRGRIVLPGVNTKFIGVTRDIGIWAEMCQGCGDCVLEKTGGVCPVSRCSKSNFNGPCGGSANGKCEISPDIDCGWQLIYERLKEINRLYRLYDIEDPKDWRTGRDGGPRKLKKREVQV